MRHSLGGGRPTTNDKLCIKGVERPVRVTRTVTETRGTTTCRPVVGKEGRESINRRLRKW